MIVRTMLKFTYSTYDTCRTRRACKYLLNSLKFVFSGHTYYDDEEYIHLNKKELTRGALLFGGGLLKGIILTGLINNANNGITIGKKR